MGRSRKKYDYAFIIQDLEIEDEFNSYAQKHPSVSFNRNARAFLAPFKWYYQKPCYEVGQTRPFLTYVEELVKTGEVEIAE